MEEEEEKKEAVEEVAGVAGKRRAVVEAAGRRPAVVDLAGRREEGRGGWLVAGIDASSGGCNSQEGEKMEQSRGGDKTLVRAVDGELGR